MNTKFGHPNNKIILEGCNGDWSQKHYLPLLVKKAAKGDIKLWSIDVEDEIQLKNPQIKKWWEIAQSHNKVHYLNKIKNKLPYNRLSDATYVFIVTPDQYHCRIAEFWLERLVPKGKIFIEKPLDAFMRSALKLGQNIEERNREDAIHVFSHYLTRAYPFFKDKNRKLDQIGKIDRIEFNILESSPIPSNRAKALNKGIIFDLFGHILALSGALIERNLTCSKSILQKVKLRNVKAARYYDCPIVGETLSQVKFVFDSVEVTSLMGKGMAQDDKVMILYGTNGIIKLNFLSNTFLVFNHQGQLDPKPVESFLEEVIEKDKQPTSIPGILDFEAGIEILAILDEAKMRIDRIVDYQVGEAMDSILKRL